jgi:hypothetical protein
MKALVKDGVSETLLADEMHRVTMTSGPDAFYYSVFEQTNMSPEVTLYRLGRDTATSEELAKVASIAFFGLARSAGGLVVDTSQGFRLHAFPAFGNDVWHIIFDSTFAIATAQSARVGIGTYDFTIPRRYPLGMKLATGEIVGAWINNDGTVGVGSQTRPAAVLSPTGVRVSQITALASNNTPGVLWTSPSGVNAQLLGGTPAPITTCRNQLGVFLSATSMELLPGIWVASWTKAGDGYLVTEGKGFGCSGTACVSDPACEGTKQETSGLRNPAVATAARAGDPPGTTFVASATPLLGPSPDGASVTSAIALTVSKMVIRGMNLEATTENIGTVELSRMAPVGVDFEGPDWPAVSILPPNKVAVAWLEPNTPSGDKLRVERYRICAP